MIAIGCSNGHERQTELRLMYEPETDTYFVICPVCGDDILSSHREFLSNNHNVIEMKPRGH